MRHKRDKQLARYLADFNRPGYVWQVPQEEPRGWGTLMVVLAVLALAATYLWR